MSDVINIGHVPVGLAYPPFIIAEMSGNHNKSIDRALALVDAAAASGAHAVKLQTYTADTMTLDVDMPGFVIEDKNSLWAGRSLYSLYDEAHTPWEWHKKIFERAKEKGLICFSSPFDETAVDFLESLNAPAYKIASFENTDLPLISRVAKTGKPMIISTGMATLDEISEAVETARSNGCEELIILKCTSAYPASPADANLKSIPDMRDRFGVQVGLSDHTMGVGVPVASVVLGATVIEKHYTLSRNDGGPDAAFSLEPDELKSLVEETHKAWQSLGKVNYGTASDVESKSKAFRRSLYFVKEKQSGEEILAGDVRAIRPGYGLPPKYLPKVIGSVLTSDVKVGTPVSLDLLASD